VNFWAPNPRALVGGHYYPSDLQNKALEGQNQGFCVIRVFKKALKGTLTLNYITLSPQIVPGIVSAPARIGAIASSLTCAALRASAVIAFSAEGGT